ncbi:DUF1102 domain-containing protein [Halovivax limisalsi]|uniref:DUF1102 domain-containing protein n=1 Tax=Halovivax limisalsi TaxID=1453760 RepID=UPI001FFCEEE5|nr:DUF1102 domain-containing protein [Halovivax limisalsi]
MQRRTFLAGVGSTTIGASALVGTGAFSRVESDRAVSIAVAEDPNAYLGLDKCDSPNGSYAHLDDNGHLKIYMDEDNPTRDSTPLGAGINSNSTSWFHNVFQICNQGKESACIWIQDDDNWPTYEGDRRVEFYLGADDEASVVGEGNAVSLDVGECICVGIRTKSYGLEEGDMLLDALDNDVTIVADVDGDCGQTPTCPHLYGEYVCTTYEQDGDGYKRTGTEYTVGNDGAGSGASVTYDLAIADSPGEFRSDHSLGSSTSEIRSGDASVPLAGLLFWESGSECNPLAQTWAQYKTENGLEDLADWYSTEGHGVPAEAPSDVDDDLLVVEVDLPAEGEPDETISPEQYPEMSDEASAQGWRTCDEQH